MATANDFPLDPIDGSLAEIEKEDGSSVIYKYDAADGAWKVVGQNGGGSQYITALDVNTTADPPVTPAGWVGLRTIRDIEVLTNQKLVNWFLAEAIITNADHIGDILVISDDEPELGENGEQRYIFWYNGTENSLYFWDQEKFEWVPTNDGRYVNTAGDTMTGNLRFQLGNKTSPQFHIMPNVGAESTNIYTSGNGQMRFRTSHTDDPTENVGSHIILDPNGGDPVTRIYNVEYPTVEHHAASKEYSDDQDEILQGQIDEGLETQAEIQGQIEELGNKISALEGSVIDASWEFTQSNSSPRTGEFGLYVSQNVGATTWESATNIIINGTDADGQTYTFDKITVNDVIRMGAENGTSAEYKITAIAVPGMYIVEYLRGSGQPTDNTLYAFTFLSAFDPEGLATIDYVDNQDNTRVKKAGDDITGPLNFTTNSGILDISGDKGSVSPRYIKVRGNNDLQILGYPGQTNTAWKKVFAVTQPADENPSLLLDYIPDPTNNGHAVPLRYANNTYLKLSGGTVTGNVTMQGGTIFFRDSDGNEKARIQGSNGFIRSYDQVRVDRTTDANCFEARRSGTTNAAIKSSGSATFKTSVKKDNKELATEEFVTNSIPAAPDLSNYLTKSGTETITGKKTFGNSHASNVTAIDIKGRLQINGASGGTGQVLTSGSTSSTVSWSNIVKTTSGAAGNGGFYQSGGALYYVTL